MTRRDVALLILFLLLGSGITVAHKLHQGILPAHVRVEGLEFLRGPLHTFTEAQEAQLATGGHLALEAGRGDVEVMTWSEPKVRVEVKKQIHREKEEEAAIEAAQLHLEILPVSGGLLARTVGSPRSGLETQFTLMVPVQSRLQVVTESGSVTVHGLKGDVVLKTAHGDVDVADIGGSLEVLNDNGSITLHRVQGAVVLRTTHGDIKGSDLASTTEVACEHGDTTLSRLAGSLKATHSHGDLGISKVGGEVRVTASNSDITLEDVRGALELVNEHGRVRLERAGADVKLNAPHCDVTVENVEGSLNATVQADPLEASFVKGAVKVQASASSVKLSDVRGPILVAATHTPVEIVRPGSDIEVATTNQEIEVTSPAGKGFRLDARTEQGEVESNIAELHLPEDRPSRFAGVVGNGQARYRLTTSHSTISILSSEPASAGKRRP